MWFEVPGFKKENEEKNGMALVSCLVGGLDGKMTRMQSGILSKGLEKEWAELTLNCMAIDWLKVGGTSHFVQSEFFFHFFFVFNTFLV